MKKTKGFKSVSKDKYTKEDLSAIDSFAPQDKKFGREVLSVSVSRDIRVWIEDVVKYLNHQSKKKITKSDVAFLALSQLKAKPYEQILGEWRSL